MQLSFAKFFLFLFFLNQPAFAQEFVQDNLNLKKDSVADIYLSAGKKYFSISETGKGYIEMLRAQSLYKQTGNKKGEESVYISLAKFYERNLSWPDAETYYQKAFLLAGEKDSVNSASIAFSLANALSQQHNYEDALKFYSYSLNQFNEEDNKGRMAACYTQIASIRKNQGNYSDAEDLLLHRVLPLLRSAGDEFGRTDCFDVLGHVYHEQKRYSEAKWFFIQANTQSRNLKDTAGIITSLINLAKVKIDIKDDDLAIRDLKEAEILAMKKNMLAALSDIKQEFAIAYQDIGNKKLSGKYMKEYQLVKNLVISDQRNRKIAAIRAKSEAEKALNPLNSVQAEEALIKGPVKNKMAIYFLSGLIVLMIASGILLFSMFRKK